MKVFCTILPAQQPGLGVCGDCAADLRDAGVASSSSRPSGSRPAKPRGPEPPASSRGRRSDPRPPKLLVGSPSSGSCGGLEASASGEGLREAVSWPDADDDRLGPGVCCGSPSAVLAVPLSAGRGRRPPQLDPRSFGTEFARVRAPGSGVGGSGAAWMKVFCTRPRLASVEGRRVAGACAGTSHAAPRAAGRAGAGRKPGDRRGVSQKYAQGATDSGRSSGTSRAAPVPGRAGAGRTPGDRSGVSQKNALVATNSGRCSSCCGLPQPRTVALGGTPGLGCGVAEPQPPPSFSSRPKSRGSPQMPPCAEAAGDESGDDEERRTWLSMSCSVSSRGGACHPRTTALSGTPGLGSGVPAIMYAGRVSRCSSSRSGNPGGLARTGESRTSRASGVSDFCRMSASEILVTDGTSKCRITM
mmetsp:Transcript_42198/g.125203  ORF Transcript_42198/g.125203 Transcript_42198/m.125203 type:complete len:415 (+) Transcript_42198:642-1886(+)